MRRTRIWISNGLVVFTIWTAAMHSARNVRSRIGACVDWRFSDAPSSLFIGIAKRNGRAHQALLRNAEQLFGVCAPLSSKPADAGANAIRFGSRHNALTQSALVIRLHIFRKFVPKNLDSAILSWYYTHR